MKYLAVLLLFLVNLVHAEVIPIQPIEKCFLCSSDPSMTMYWQGKNSKAVQFRQLFIKEIAVLS